VARCDAAGARAAAARGAAIAAQLPARTYLVNLCEQRECFVLAFAAA
jgi:hypothetical protein